MTWPGLVERRAHGFVGDWLYNVYLCRFEGRNPVHYSTRRTCLYLRSHAATSGKIKTRKATARTGGPNNHPAAEALGATGKLSLTWSRAERGPMELVGEVVLVLVGVAATDDAAAGL